MPLYEYRCLSCGAEFEKLQHFSDPPVTTCEVCGGPVKKLISQTSFILKGTGWYVTDYARKGQSGGANGSHAKKTTSSSSESTSPAAPAKEAGKESAAPKKAQNEAA